jgi:hypothetical protein
MSPGFAAATRQNLPQLMKLLSERGELVGIEFKKVGPGGADTYHVTWKQDAGDWGIIMGRDGTIEGAGGE